MKTHYIIGSGISGLIGALLLKKKYPNENVTIIEKEETLGGLLNGFKYENGLIFDSGMHNTNETGIKELDKILWDILGEGWNVLEGKYRDLAGSYFNNKLQFNSIYPDIRPLLKEKPSIHNEIIDRLNKNLENPKNNSAKNVEEFGLNVYGKTITNLVIKPIIEKIFHSKISELHPLALSIVPLERLVIFDEPLMSKLIDNELIRSISAYPEQKNLPLKYSSGRRSLYPKKIGTYQIIEELRKQIINLGGSILTSSYIKSIDIVNNNISKMTLINNSSESSITNIASILWTVGLPQLYKSLGLTNSLSKPDLAPNTYVCNYILNKEINCKDLQYLHCYDEDMFTFRVNNYTQYCPFAISDMGHPVSSELIYSDDQSAENVLKNSLSDLRHIGLIDNRHDIKFSRVEKLRGAFPMPTNKNIELITRMSNEISSLSVNNLVTAGILSNEKLFFQRHVLPDLYSKLT